MSDTAIEFSGVSKSFPSPSGPVLAVNDISFSVPVGQVLALLGPNGAGKSTTIDMLLGLGKPASGSIKVLGTTAQKAIKDGHVAAMLQQGDLLPDLKVRELLHMMSLVYDHDVDVDNVMKTAGVQDIADRKTQKLSGGQSQRVKFALALLARPKLIVLDEPTAALDVDSRRGFWSGIRELTKTGTTILFATHYLEEADQYADRIILMAKGAVVADGTPGEIKARVGARTIRATLPGVLEQELKQLAGVRDVVRSGDAVLIHCSDADLAAKQLFALYPVKDVEIRSAGIEDAFVALTGESHA